MNESNKISIVLPVYNGEKHLKESIDSILSQTYTNLELIVVNDCSTDNTASILNECAVIDARVKIINNEINLKLPKSLNVGFSNATGEYYTWTSDDNKYKPNAIEEMINAIQSNKNINMIYSDYTNIDENGNILEEVLLQEPDRLVTSNTVGACFLYTKEIADRVGEYDPNLFLAEDYDYWMRMYGKGSIMHIRENLYLYRRHSQSLTQKHREKIQQQTYKALKKNFFDMYVKAIESGLRDQFFDHIMKRAGDSEFDKIKKELLTICPGYKMHLLKVQLRDKYGKRS